MKKSNFIYQYDGSFINLLNLINKLFHEEVIPLAIKDSNYNPNLFDKVINIKFNNDELVISKIIKYYGSSLLNALYLLYLSNDENKEMLMYYFWFYFLKYKSKIFYRRDIDVINKALKVIKYVQNENHKFKGFLRFVELKNNVLYAQMEPENNILPLLVKHFSLRLKNEYWLILDKKRNIIGLYDKNKVYILNTSDVYINEEFSSDEVNIQQLWKSFYKTIGIAARKNDRCRMNFMPKKYWKYILEVSDEK